VFTQVIRNQDKIELGFVTEDEIELHVTMDAADAREFAERIFAATSREVIFA